MEELLGLLKAVMLQEGTLVLLSGEAGIGKTRLAEEFEEKAAKVDCITIVGRCLPGYPIPFLPFIEAFRQYFQTPRERSRNAAEESLFGKMDDTIQTSWSMDSILFSTLEFVRRKTAFRPIIIRIEDLHWVDSASVQLLHFLARNAKGLKLLLLGTYRPEDLITDTSGRPHPFLEGLRTMRREGLCHEIEVGTLEPVEVRLLVTGVLGAGLENNVMDKVVEESEGNPLYTIETVKLLALSESIHYSEGLWKASGSMEIKIPPTVKEVILRRLERVERVQRRLLDYASVVGREFDVETIGEATKSNRIDLLENLERIECEGRLICQKGDAYQFSHETIRQVAYESITDLRRKEIHRIVGEVLEGQRGKASPAILAQHFHLGGDRSKCVMYSVLAGESCLSRGAAYEAVRLLEQVVQCAGEIQEYEKQLIQAYDSLGMAYLLLGRMETANEMLQKVVANVGIENASSRTLYNLAEIWAGTSMGKGNQTMSSTYLDMAERAPGCDQYLLGKIAAYRATSSLWDGDHADAEKQFLLAIDSMMRAKDVDRAIMYKSYYADVLLTQGRVEEALDEIQEALGLSKGTPGFYGELEANFYAGTIHLHIGNVDDAIRHLNRCVDIATQIGEFSAICHGYTYLALAWEMADEIEEAIAAARMSYENACRTESPLILLNGIAGFLHMMVRVGNLEEAGRLFDEAIRLQTDFHWSMHSTTRCLLTTSMAEFKGAREEWGESDRLYQQSLELMSGTPNGLLLEALSRAWYGSTLLERGLREEARKQLALTIDICSKLHNAYLRNEATRMLECID